MGTIKKDKNGMFYTQYRTGIPDKYNNNKEKRNSLANVIMHHFMEIAHSGKEFEIKKAFVNKNNTVICLKLLKTVKTPLFVNDTATYYLYHTKRFYKGWNVSLFYDDHVADVDTYTDKANIWQYSDIPGLGVPVDIIESLLHDDGMSCLVVGTPVSYVEMDEYNNILSSSFDAAYYYLTRENIKKYFKKHKRYASYESKYHGPVYGFAETLFSGQDPFQ